MSRPSSRPSRARAARRATVLTAAVALCALAAPAAFAASAAPAPSASHAPKLPAGLYGATDPTYDGVYRQATALLALDAVKVAPAASAVNWLTGQICADGGFEAYRADPATPCTAKDEDTNSTGLAVQALAALGGHRAVVTRAVHWLASQQSGDGGWGYQPGLADDADSTTVVIGALSAAGTDPASVAKRGHTPADALLALQLGCDAKTAQRGAFAYQPDPKSGKLTANDKATTDGVLGTRGSGYLVAAPRADRSPEPLKCASDKGGASDAGAAAEAGSAYLSATLAANGQHLTTAQPGATTKTTDFGTTADAVLALASDGHRAAAVKPYDWLAGNGADGWAKGSPAGLGSLILASAAVGANPHDFGGADLVSQLLATGPAPAARPTSPAAARHTTHNGGGLSAWWLIGVGLVAGIGIGWAYSLRAKKKA